MKLLLDSSWVRKSSCMWGPAGQCAVPQEEQGAPVPGKAGDRTRVAGTVRGSCPGPLSPQCSSPSPQAAVQGPEEPACDTGWGGCLHPAVLAAGPGTESAPGTEPHVPGSKHSTSGGGVGWPEGEHPGLRPNTPTGSYRGEGSWAVPRGPASCGLCALRGGGPGCSGTTTVVGWVSLAFPSRALGFTDIVRTRTHTRARAHRNVCTQKYSAHAEIHVHTQEHTQKHVCTWGHTCTHGNAHAHMETCVHTHEHGNVHTQEHMNTHELEHGASFIPGTV